MRHAALLLALPLLFPGQPASAAESYDNCTGFIDSVPATISTQGNWCMRADLSSALASGAMITIATNNVVLDCKDFKLGGLAAGAGTAAVGIIVVNRANLTVRNCNIRGFALGLQASNGTGHLIENNRFEANRYTGIFVQTPGSMIRGNLVVDTGDTPLNYGATRAIYVSSGTDVVDNTINGVNEVQAGNPAYGIYTDTNGGGVVSRNRIRGISPGAGGFAYGIWNDTVARTASTDNTVIGEGLTNSVGIRCASFAGAAYGNTVAGFQTAIQGCSVLGNYVNAN